MFHQRLAAKQEVRRMRLENAVSLKRRVSVEADISPDHSSSECSSPDNERQSTIADNHNIDNYKSGLHPFPSDRSPNDLTHVKNQVIVEETSEDLAADNNENRNNHHVITNTLDFTNI